MVPDLVAICLIYVAFKIQTKILSVPWPWPWRLLNPQGVGGLGPFFFMLYAHPHPRQPPDLPARARQKKIDGPPRTLTKSQTHPPTIRLFFFLDFFF
jgi:hypothetical protein